MTEAEWNRAKDPEPMLAHLRAASVSYNVRRSRLFALACCVRTRRFFTDPRLHAALTFAEQHAEKGVKGKKGRAGLVAELTRFYDELDAERDRLFDQQRTPRFCQVLISIGSCMAATRLLSPYLSAEIASVFEIVADSTAWERALEINPEHPPLWHHSRQKRERAAQAVLVREVFGNPFQPVTIDPRWRTETVRLLATGIDTDRAYDRLPILADALEEAGCDAADILTHCRGAGPHVRGCWVVDLVLGKL